MTLAREYSKTITTLVRICRLCKENFFPKNKKYWFCENCRDSGLTISQRTYRSNWAAAQLRMKRAYCKKYSIEFDLLLEDIVVPDICPVLKIPLIVNLREWGKDNSPSIDRINPKSGYIKNNIAVISMKANRIKNDATVEELEKVLSWLKNQ